MTSRLGPCLRCDMPNRQCIDKCVDESELCCLDCNHQPTEPPQEDQ